MVACVLLAMTLPALYAVSALGASFGVVLLLVLPLAVVAVLARGWFGLCRTPAGAWGHAAGLVLVAVLLGGLTGYLVASGSGLRDGSIDAQIGGLLVGLAVVVLAPSLWLALLGSLDRRRLLPTVA